MGDSATIAPPATATTAEPAAGDWRIDDLAHRAGVSVDTIRYYQREGLLPTARRKGRHKLYGQDHLLRLARIRELQDRRFSLAAIRALLEASGNVEGIFGGGPDTQYSADELSTRSGLSAGLIERLHSVGLVSDPEAFGRDAYDGADLDVLHAIAELQRVGIPDDVLVEISGIYAEGVESIEEGVFAVFTGERGRSWDPEELAAFQSNTAEHAPDLVPLVMRMVTYLHLRTLQRLTLGAIEENREA
jgi:DNA-binding transcriptional MerR regulator